MSLRDRFKRWYNAHVPLWGEAPNLIDLMPLEEMPHLVRQLTVSWNTPRCVEFLESLLIDDREGNRTGFGLAAYQDILLLLGIARENAAQANFNKGDPASNKEPASF